MRFDTWSRICSYLLIILSTAQLSNIVFMVILGTPYLMFFAVILGVCTWLIFIVLLLQLVSGASRCELCNVKFSKVSAVSAHYCRDCIPKQLECTLKINVSSSVYASVNGPVSSCVHTQANISQLGPSLTDFADMNASFTINTAVNLWSATRVPGLRNNTDTKDIYEDVLINMRWT